MLGLLLRCIAENACSVTWRNRRTAFREIELAQFVAPYGEIWQVTEPSQAALKEVGSTVPVVHVALHPTQMTLDARAGDGSWGLMFPAGCQ